MTSVPSPTFGPNGFVTPSDSSILAGVQADLNAAFGGGVNPALNTPQGQLATSLSAITANTDQTFLLYTQLIDPSYSFGRMQDAIGRIYFLERKGAQATVVQAVCTGTAAVIPVGASAIAEDGNIYTCQDGGTLPPLGGSITLTFACNALGPIACPEGSLNRIYQAISGWDSITNLTDGIIGTNTESKSAFEARRAASVAGNSHSSLTSLLGAVLSVPGVLDAYTAENDTNAPLTIGGYTLAANSLYVAAVGGTDADVAQAIWTKKAPGCGYNGNTTVSVQDTNYSPPYPTYNVSFERPIPLPVLFKVVLLNNAQIPSNAVSLVQNAIVQAFAGADGGSRARIGGTILASRFYAPVAALGPWALIDTLEVGSVNSPLAVFVGSISGSTLTVKSVASGTLAVGQTVGDPDQDSDAADGTVITALGSGSGGTGTYAVSTPQTVSGAAFTGTGSGTNLTTSAVTGVIRVGDFVFGTGAPANTHIVSQTSGVVGGAGVYVTNNATTSSGDALTTGTDLATALPNGPSVSVNVDQVPTVSALNIAVSTT